LHRLVGDVGVLASRRDRDREAAATAWGLAFAPVRTRWLRLAVVPLDEVPLEDFFTAVAAAPSRVRVFAVFANPFAPVLP
jgi:hypothetical protein